MKKENLLYIILLMAAGMTACKKSGNSGGGSSSSGDQPSVKVSDVTQGRQTQASAFRFYIDLNATSKQPVSVNYTTLDGTAKAGSDYTAASGTLTIAAGQTEGFVDVQVKGDSLRQANQVFFLQLSNPVNGTLGVSNGTATILNSDLLYLPTDSTGYSTPTSYAGYHLAWSDEFNGSSVNASDWNFESGNNNGWGNHELENYTSRSQNAFVSAGHLVIEARQESYGGNSYTSARMTTQGKQQFSFGRIDIRAKLPVAHGMWPALWMLGSNISSVPWPGCGEIDNMELVGKTPSQVLSSLHWQQQGGTEGTYNGPYNLSGQDFSQQFHVFSMIWANNSVQFLVDDHVYVTGGLANVSSGTYPFNSPFFFIFNVAVGGDFPGPPDNTTLFPQRMFVDYIRVFQQ